MLGEDEVKRPPMVALREGCEMGRPRWHTTQICHFTLNKVAHSISKFRRGNRMELEWNSNRTYLPNRTLQKFGHLFFHLEYTHGY